MNEQLTNLGLLDTEGKVYVAALALGTASASNIARHASVKRPTTYVALERLIEYGLISEIPNKKEKLFKAEDPEKLRRLTKKLRQKAIKAEIALDTLLPELKSIKKNLLEAPKVTFHPGTAGVIKVAEEVSESRSPWYFFGASEEIVKTLGHQKINEVMLETNELREKAARPMSYYITDKGFETVKRFQKQNPAVRKVKFLPETIKPQSILFIYDSKVGIININESPFGVIIESKEVVELLKIMYKLVWKNLR